MDDFRGKLAVITGGGSGMGRAIAQQLTSEGCHIAICDMSAESMAETRELCQAAMPEETRISEHLCSVSPTSSPSTRRSRKTPSASSAPASWA